MRTLADAAALALFCGLLWFPVRALIRVTRGRVVRVLVLAVAAAVTTAAAVALGVRREHLRVTVVSVAVTFGGMCVFWTLVWMQSRRRATEPEADVARGPERPVPSAGDLVGASPATATSPVPHAPSDDALPLTLTRRQRRESRHRFGRRRRPSNALR